MQVQLYLESFRELIHVVLNLRPRVVISKEHAPRAQRLPEDAHLKVGFISLVRGVQVDEINLTRFRFEVPEPLLVEFTSYVSVLARR